MPTEEKVAVVEDLKHRLDGVKAVVLTEYRGLTVLQIGELRRQLRAVSAEYKVIKNRLARIAVSSKGLESLAAQLKGPTGLVLVKDDPVAVARTVHAFARTNQALNIKGGYVDGQLMQPAELKALAELPSREALRAQLAGTLQGPLAQLVGLLAAAQRDLAYVLAERGKGTAEGGTDAAAGATA